jgi:arylsulfatase A
VSSVMDWMPTFAALAGAEMPDDRVIDGRDVGPMLTNAPGGSSPHEALYFFQGPRVVAVRTGPWKLHRVRGTKVPAPLLYDLRSDLGERKNVAAEHPDVVKRIEAEAGQLQANVAEHGRPRGTVGDTG